MKSELVEGEDFYFEGPYMVFTAAYLLKRGYCCGSGCRHCPYAGQKAGEKDECKRQTEEERPETRRET